MHRARSGQVERVRGGGAHRDARAHHADRRQRLDVARPRTGPRPRCCRRRRDHAAERDVVDVVGLERSQCTRSFALCSSTHHAQRAAASAGRSPRGCRRASVAGGRRSTASAGGPDCRRSGSARSRRCRGTPPGESASRCRPGGVLRRPCCPLASGSSGVSKCVTLASMKFLPGKCIRKPSCRTRPYAAAALRQPLVHVLDDQVLRRPGVVAFDEEVQRAVHGRVGFANVEAGFVGEARVARGVDVAVGFDADGAEPRRELDVAARAGARRPRRSGPRREDRMPASSTLRSIQRPSRTSSY